jgi:glycerol kinase
MIQKDRASFRRLFSGTKLKWMDNIEGAREKQNKKTMFLEPWTLG